MGRITRAHGVKGEVSVLPLSQVEARFEPGARVFLGEDEARPLTVRRARPNRGRLLVEFEEIGDRDAAEGLGGEYVFVPAEWAPTLPEGEFWTHDLVGCEVLTEGGRPLGTVREVIHSQANDVWVTEGDGGEVLVPALKDVVVSVDVKTRRIVVREIAGLTTE